MKHASETLGACKSKRALKNGRLLSEVGRDEEHAGELMLEIFNHWRKELRIRFLGPIEVRGVRQFCFHDLETNTNFHVPRLEQLEQTLAVHRQSPNRKGDDQ